MRLLPYDYRVLQGYTFNRLNIGVIITVIVRWVDLQSPHITSKVVGYISFHGDLLLVPRAQTHEVAQRVIRWE